MADIPRLKLGSQGLEVSKLGFGCMGLTGVCNDPVLEEVHMPTMNGYEFLQHVSKEIDVPVIEVVPKRILEEMNVPGLTKENVASHLQEKSRVTQTQEYTDAIG
ncbi:hypothetical protein JHK82_052788 [Glycine max]|nr:hypothetical protein JHK86_052641 [Glycine max]KAG4927006.1 hypothetical protein JHK85_053492 [Glycine max]KAG5082632.1 hypothetical protein JHK84_052670 [Glycine max]KAG5085391.1 hypothetical protein JHK82_052788 [Glycine max]